MSRSPPLTPSAWLRYDAIRRGLEEANPRRVLEVGVGEGAMACRLAARFDYKGLEPDPASFTAASKRLSRLGRGEILRATTAELPHADPYDLVCAFEVLEHLVDDRAELERWRDLLRPGGHVLVSVPAHRRHFGPADEAVGHQRRYDREDLHRILTAAALEPLWIEAWGLGLGHLLEWARDRIARRMAPDSAAEGTARSGRWLQPRAGVTGTLAALVAAPFRVLQHPMRRSSVGIGWVALARRSG